MPDLRSTSEAAGGPTRVTRTVMFVDRVGSTAAAAALGDVQADVVQQRHDRLVHGAILRHGGAITKHTGDGAMATFESAGQAVHAAIAAQRAVADETSWPEGAIAIRIGLSVGDVLPRDGDFFGMTAVEAQRLEVSCRPGEIRCTDLVLAVARLGADVVVHPLEPVHAKGLPAPLAAHLVDWRASTADGSAGVELPGVLTVPTEFELVGRRSVLRTLSAALLDTLDADEFHAVLLGGEPGIGKTRLARELAERAAVHGATVLAGHADEGSRSAYQPFTDAMRWQATHHPDGFATPVDFAADGADRGWLFDAVARWLEDSAKERPVYLVLDDLHWAAPETLLLVTHLVRRRPARVMLVITYRDTEVDEGSALSRMLADLDRMDATHVRLRGLTIDDLEQLTEHRRSNDGDEVPVDALLDRTGGNPLFIGEYLRMLERDGGAVADSALPDTVVDVIRRRVARAGDTATSVLTVAAVIGHTFDLRTVRGVTDLPVSTLAEVLESARAGRLVDEVDAGTYQFAHALVRTVLHDLAPKTRRAALHADVATTLAGMPPSAELLSQLAYHWIEAAPVVGVEPAVAASRAAGDDALRRHAPLEAARHLDYVAAHAPAPEARRAAMLDAAVARMRGGDPAHREALLQVAAAAADAGDHPTRVRALVASGRWGYTRVSDSDPAKLAAIRAALRDIEPVRIDLHAALSAALAIELVFDGDDAERAARCDTATTLAMDCGAPEVLAEVAVRINQVAPLRTGGAQRRDALVALTHAGLAAARSTGDHELLVRNLNNAYFSLMQHGLPQDAITHASELAALADRTGDPFSRRHVDMFEPVLLLLRGDLEGSVEASRRAHTRWTADGVPEAAGFKAVERFAAARESGRLPSLAGRMAEGLTDDPTSSLAHAMFAVAAAGSDAMRDAAAEEVAAAAEDAFERVPDDAIWLVAMVLWADAAAAVADRTACECLQEILTPWSGTIGSTGGLFVGAVDRALGLAAATCGHSDLAIERLRSALDLHRAAESPLWTARSLLDLAAVGAATGHDADTRAWRDECGQILGAARLPALEAQFAAG